MREPIGKRYYKIVGSKKYRDWQSAVLEKIYSDVPFLRLGDNKYPVVCYQASTVKEVSTASSSYDLLLDMEMFDIKKTICNNFKEIVDPHIRNKDELAYVLHVMNINDQSELEWFATKVGSYEQIMYTSNVLEYEMYKYYRKTRGEIPTCTREDILNNLPLRKCIHGNNSQFYTITHGKGFNPGINLQVFYSYYDEGEAAYKTPYGILPDNIASKQGQTQLLPEGGYRLRNKSLADNEKLFKNYKMDIACYKLILEQLYGYKEIAARDDVSFNPKGNPILFELTQRYARGDGFFEMLGVTIDLVTLRPTISFISRIDDAGFSYTKDLNSSNEKLNVETMKVRKLKEFMRDSLVTNESAGMYNLLQNNRVFKSMVAQDED